MAEYTVSRGDRSHIVAVERAGDRLRVVVDGAEHRVALERRGGATYFVLDDGSVTLPVIIRRVADERLVGIKDEQYRLRVEPRLPIPRRGGRGSSVGPLELLAPMPGLVVAVEVAVGDGVSAGQVMLIIEAMKMQSEIRAPLSGRVASVGVRAGQEVMGGAVLAVIEPTE